MPRTLVTFHAHPDDEAIITAGAMLRAVADGHRVVLVLATKGEHGEVADGVLRPGEALWERRMAETAASAEILGVSRVVWLGYLDSGMAGTPENDAEGSFWSADVDAAAGRLAAILVEEDADVLTVYDERGIYEHPDHLQVHRVGVRAAGLAGTPLVYGATVDRDEINRMRDESIADGSWTVEDDPAADGGFDLGMSGDHITTTIDVRPYLDDKRSAMAAHASQIGETSFFLQLSPEMFEQLFGREWYIRIGERPEAHEDDLFAALA